MMLRQPRIIKAEIKTERRSKSRPAARKEALRIKNDLTNAEDACGFKRYYDNACGCGTCYGCRNLIRYLRASSGFFGNVSTEGLCHLKQQNDIDLAFMEAHLERLYKDQRALDGLIHEMEFSKDEEERDS